MNDHLRETVAGQSIQHLVCNRALSSRPPAPLPEQTEHDRPTPVYEEIASFALATDAEITAPFPSPATWQTPTDDDRPTGLWFHPPQAEDAEEAGRSPAPELHVAARLLLTATLFALPTLIMLIWSRLSL